MKIIYCVLATLILFGCKANQHNPSHSPSHTAKALPTVVVEVLADDLPGYELFINNGCPVCHNKDLSGTDIGPALIFPLYKSSHHSNDRLFTSIKNGVDKHHWPFGDMPAHSHIPDQDIHLIVRFIRESLKLNNIR